MFLIWKGRKETLAGFLEEAAFELSLTGQMDFDYSEKQDCVGEVWKGKQEIYSREKQELQQQTSLAGG